MLDQLPPLALFAALFAAPFLQEDAAVLGGVGAAAYGAHPALALSAVMSGLIVSDSWKYFAGRFAGRIGWVARIAHGPVAQRLSGNIDQRLGRALFIARFVPGTRVPLYVLSGARKAPAAKFFAFMIGSAVLYVGAALALVVVLGAEHGGKALTALAIALGVFTVANILWRNRDLLSSVEKTNRRSISD